MFICVHCKEEFNGNPAMRNAAGEFCQDCENIRKQNARLGMLARKRHVSDVCIWCGDKLTKSNRQTGKDNEQVCKRCSNNRDWFLRCVRYSDKAAKYAAMVEERERPLREKRQEEILRLSNSTQNKADKTNGDIESRVMQLESIAEKQNYMLAKIMDAFGVE